MADVTATYAARQTPLSAVVEFTFATFTEDQVDQVIKLPAGAIITDVILQVKTAWDNTTPTFNVGLFSNTPTDPDDFLDGVSLGTGDETFQASLRSADEEAAMDASDLNHITNGDEIAILYAAAGGTAAAGAATLIVEYVVSGRSNENQG